MALVMLFTWSPAWWPWDVSLGTFQELPQQGQWDTAVPGGVPVLTWPQAVQVTTATMGTAKLE